MTSLTRLGALLLFSTAACITSADVPDVDEPIDDAELGKDDSSSSLRHYLLTALVPDGEIDLRSLSRAGGGSLRCMNGEVQEVCAVSDYDLVTAASLGISSYELLDELEDHPVIVRGRLVTLEGRIVLKISAITRAITTVIPMNTICYRLRPVAGTALDHRFERLDSSYAEVNGRLYWDSVDPTPDLWGQVTPSVQRKVDDALALAKTRPVYTCGDFDRRDSGDLYWAQQLFAPRR